MARAGAGNPGLVSMEFGYVDALLHPLQNIRAGMVLVPVGIINEVHEPGTYFGALRSETESQMIPCTWRTNGVGLLGGTNSRYYFTVAYDIMRHLMRGCSATLQPYFQYESLNKLQAVPASFASYPALDRSNLTFGSMAFIIFALLQLLLKKQNPTNQAKNQKKQIPLGNLPQN